MSARPEKKDAVKKGVLKSQIEFAYSKAKFPAMIGGLGSGKSAGAMYRVLHLLFRDRCNIGYFLPTYDLITLMALPRFEAELMRLGVPHRLNKSEYKITIHGKGEIIFRSMDRPERIVAFEIGHAIVDELDTLPKEKASYIYRKIKERTRQQINAHNTIGIVTTPDQGFNGHVYELYGETEDPEYHLVKASTYDNHYLPDDYTDQIISSYDEELARLYLQGEFVSLSHDKVYHFFDRERHHTDREVKDGEPLHIGLDFNVGACAGVVFVREQNKLIAVAEFLSRDTYDMVNNIHKLFPNRNITLYPDSSGRANRTNASRSDIQILQDAGFTINAPKANGAVKDRVNSVNALFSHDRLMVNTLACPRLTHALEVQGYDDKGEPEKFNEHKGGAVDDWCFSGDTMVEVNGEKMRFDSIPESGYVVGHDGEWKPYVNGGSRGLSKLCVVKLSSGRIIRATPDHEFLTLNGWVMAKNLQGETLCESLPYQNHAKNLTGLNFIVERMATFTRRLVGSKEKSMGRQEKASIAMFGSFLTEKFQTITTFITSMTTGRITRLKTLNACLAVSTENTTAYKKTRPLSFSSRKIERRQFQRPQNGTQAKMVENGTKSTMSEWATRCTRGLGAFAKCAAKNMRQDHKQDTETSIAQKTAAQRREEIAESIMSQENVNFVGMNSRSTNTTKIDFVEEVVPGNTEEVFCLSVPTEGCFSLASGHIVSNCDSMGYPVVRIYPVVRNSFAMSNYSL